MKPHRPPLTLESLHARAAARTRQRQRRARTQRIRRRVLAATLGLFVASWAVIGVQLADGHDPALVHDARLRAQAAAIAPRAEVFRRHRRHRPIIEKVVPGATPTPAVTPAPAAPTQTPTVSTPASTPVPPAAPAPTPVVTRQS
jgi:hypothetical protein